MYTTRTSVHCIFWRMCRIRTQSTQRILEDVSNSYTVYTLEGVYNPNTVYTADSGECIHFEQAYTMYSGGCIQSVHSVHSVFSKDVYNPYKVYFLEKGTIRTQCTVLILDDVNNPCTVYILEDVYNPYTL